jgi:hypothetical protein
MVRDSVRFRDATDETEGPDPFEIPDEEVSSTTAEGGVEHGDAPDSPRTGFAPDRRRTGFVVQRADSDNVQRYLTAIGRTG